MQNISNASTYKIILVSCGIAAVVINIIYLLLRFIMEINNIQGENKKYPQYLKKIMVIMAAIVVLDIVAWFLDFKHLAVLFQNLLYR